MARMERVVAVRTRNNASGTDMYVCTLACGHDAETRQYRAGKRLRAPTRLKCRQCGAVTEQGEAL